MLSDKPRFLLVLLTLISAIGLASCNAKAAKSSGQGKPATKGNSAIDGRIDQAVKRMIDVEGRSENKAPGIVVVYVSPRASSVRGYGTTKIGTRSRPDGDTKFAIASVTKAFTGLMLAHAVMNGVVSLEDKVQPSLKPPLKDRFDPDITYLQLVTHTSGLVNFPTNLQEYRDHDGDGKNDWSKGNPANQYSEEDLVTCMQKKECGKKYPSNKPRYSNLGSGILGIALQSELGYDSYADLLEGTVTGPLDMNDTGIYEGEFARRVPQRVAQGYSVQGGEARDAPYPNMGVLAGGGGMFTTGHDMLKFLNALTGLEDSELSRAMIEMEKELVDVGKGRVMGYAVSIKKAGGSNRAEYAKGGGAEGYSAYLIWSVDPQVGVIVMANRGKFQKAASKLAGKILSGLARNL